MKSYAFQVVIEADQFEDGKEAFHAYCPALQGCRTWGHTYEEALANIEDVIDLYIADLIESGNTVSFDSFNGIVELASPSVVVNI